MAGRPQRLCLTPGCAQLTNGQDHCVDHRKRRKATKPLARDPRNDRRWRKFRQWFLAQYPLCSDCMGVQIVKGAVDVHHILALRLGGALFEVSNCMALCHSCHSRRTQRGE